MKLLHIDSSILGEASVSRQLTRDIVARWVALNPQTVVEHLDLAQDTPAHLGADALGFRQAPGAQLSAAQQRENLVSEALVSQFLAADVVVVGAPLYNFSIPSQLKAWVDRVAQPGRTFTYTAAGPKGLAGGKTVIVASSRGGQYAGSEAGRALEHQESYLQTVFGFFGICDVRIVRAEGLAMGEAARAQALGSRGAAAADRGRRDVHGPPARTGGLSTKDRQRLTRGGPWSLRLPSSPMPAATGTCPRHPAGDGPARPCSRRRQPTVPPAQRSAASCGRAGSPTG